MKGLVKTSGGRTGFNWGEFKLPDNNVFELKVTSPYYWVMMPKQLIVPMGLL